MDHCIGQWCTGGRVRTDNPQAFLRLGAPMCFVSLIGANALPAHMLQHATCLALEVTLAAIGRISVVVFVTHFAYHSFGVVCTEAFAGLGVAHT